MIVITKGQQVVDMVAVRLFLFPHSPLTKEIHPLAKAWAIRRDIAMSYEVKNGRVIDYITLPDEYEQYMKWSLAVFMNQATQEALQVSIDLLMDIGWTSIRTKFVPFSKEEREWIWENIPNHYMDLTRRKPKS